jgi:hypothetical protein
MNLRGRAIYYLNSMQIAYAWYLYKQLSPERVRTCIHNMTIFRFSSLMLQYDYEGME